MIDAGKYRHRITFCKFNGARDASGDLRDDLDSNWVAVKSCWAAVDPVSGREFYEAQQNQSEVTHKIRCRYFPNAMTEYHIRMNGRTFRILSVIDWEERHESYLIMAKELVK